MDTILLRRHAVNGCVVVPSGWCPNLRHHFFFFFFPLLVLTFGNS